MEAIRCTCISVSVTTRTLEDQRVSSWTDGSAFVLLGHQVLGRDLPKARQLADGGRTGGVTASSSSASTSVPDMPRHFSHPSDPLSGSLPPRYGARIVDRLRVGQPCCRRVSPV